MTYLVLLLCALGQVFLLRFLFAIWVETRFANSSVRTNVKELTRKWKVENSFL